MTTLATMKSRCATELRRTNLTSQIASAITTAIEAYQGTRFAFNESRGLTFTTVQDQEFYDGDDAAFIPKLIEIDYVKYYIGDQSYDLDPVPPAWAEEYSQSGTQTGEPLSWYCWYGNQLRILPVPTTAGRTVRVGAHYKVDAPASDGEADNPWMTTAERLIRSRAKYELALHVLHNMKLAEWMSAAVNEAMSDLKGRNTDITKGSGRVQPMCF